MQQQVPKETRAATPAAETCGLGAAAVALLCGLAAGAAVARTFAYPLGQDQAWLLYAARAVLGGARLNTADIVETNPPFVVWFHMLPVLLGRLLHVGTIDAFRGFWLGVAAALGIWVANLYRRLYRPAALGLWAFVLAEMAVGLLAVNGEDLGQREHFAAMLLLPFVLGAAWRLENAPAMRRAEALAIGLAAALGVCLKPQQIAVVVLLDLLVLLRRGARRWIHPSSIAFAVALALYFAALEAFGKTYFRNVLPAMKLSYWGFEEAWPTVLHTARVPLLVWAVGITLFALRQRAMRAKALAAALLTASVGALAAYLQQHKGWHYQLLCFTVFTCLLVAVIAIDALQAWPAARGGRRAGQLKPWAVMVTAAVLSTAGMLARHAPRKGFAQPQKQALEQVFAAYPPGTAVSSLSVYPWEFPAVLAQDKVLGTRYLHLWMLGAIVRSEYGYAYEVRQPMPAQAAEAMAADLRRAEAEDLARWQPKVVAVDRCTLAQFCDPSLADKLGGLVDWMQRDPAFRAQWAHYTLQRRVAGLDIYVRTG